MSDLFHDVARAYYGVGPEVYALANIATHGNAPADYAMGCEPDAPDQYASDSLTSADRNPNEGSFSHEDIAKHIHPEAANHSHIGKVLSNLAHASDDPDLHAAAMHYNTVASRYFRHMADPINNQHVANPYHIARIAKGVAEEMENRVASHKTALANPSALSPLFHEYMPKQAEEPRPTKPTGYVSPGLPKPPKQPSDSPGQTHFKFACSQPYALGDARTTGTGTKIEQVPWEGPDPTEGAKPPFVPHQKGMTAEQDMIRRQNNEAAGHENEDFDSYGIMNAAKGLLGMGSQSAPATRPPAPPVSRDKIQARGLVKSRTIAPPVSRDKIQASADNLRKGLPIIKNTQIDYSLTGTGTHVQPEEKNCSAAKYDLPSDSVSPAKAKQILEDGTAQGHPLTSKQKKMFGAAAGKSKK